MDLGDEGSSPWGDVPSQSSPVNETSKLGQDNTAGADTLAPSSKVNENLTPSISAAPHSPAGRGPPRRQYGVQSTKLEAVKDPLGPLRAADPSILRVGNDYCIATSTFKWYPGVQTNHSKDLANWDLVVRPLSRASQLDMRGNPDSCGVWAPRLTHDGEKFYLVYTDIKRKDGSFKDTPNYIVTADRIEGPWSDPYYVNSSRFDPSLFLDDDGNVSTQKHCSPSCCAFSPQNRIFS